MNFVTRRKANTKQLHLLICSNIFLQNLIITILSSCRVPAVNFLHVTRTNSYHLNLLITSIFL